MKASLVVVLMCLIMPVISFDLLDSIPLLSPDVVVPFGVNTVYLKNPVCYFETAYPVCAIHDSCTIWLVAAKSAAKGTVDSNQPNFLNLSPYPTAFGAGQKEYFVTRVGSKNDYCPPPGPYPPYFLVGKDGACSLTNCNGLLPTDSTMSFKYVLLDSDNKPVAETKWSDDITLKTKKAADSLGSGYAGRSGAMVVITTILSVAAALLLLLLLIAVILACCCRQERTQSYDARPQRSVIGSLRIPSYDVHHLKNTASPYDNPAFEQDIKKRYTTNSTLPQKTTTVITTVPASDTITLKKM